MPRSIPFGPGGTASGQLLQITHLPRIRHPAYLLQHENPWVTTTWRPADLRSQPNPQKGTRSMMRACDGPWCLPGGAVAQCLRTGVQKGQHNPDGVVRDFLVEGQKDRLEPLRTVYPGGGR